MFKKMTFLEVLQKNQKVINSCITVEQARHSRLYTKLVNRRWYQTNAKGTQRDRIPYHEDLHRLAEYTKFMRDEKILDLRLEKIEYHREQMYKELPELVFHHPV